MKRFKNTFFIINIFVSLLIINVSYAQSLNVRPGRILKASQSKVLFVTQSVNINFQPTVKGLIGSPSSTMASPNFSMDTRATPLTATERSTLALLPIMYSPPAGEPLKTAAEVQKKAQGSLEANRATLIDRFKSLYLTRFGVGSAWFNYSQDVKVIDPLGASADTTVTLFWSLSLDLKGEPMFTGIQLLPQSPVILQATYTPLAVADGLPAAWRDVFIKREKSGFLRYRFLKLDGTPVISTKANTDVQGWISIDYKGTFDEPPDSATDDVDINRSLKCLIDNNAKVDESQPSFCSPAMRDFADIKTLITNYGASMAYLLYYRKVEPVYDTVIKPGTDPNNPEYESFAKISLKIDTRTVTRGTDCNSLNYRNTGAYGFTLENKGDIYLVQPGGDYQSLGSISPPERLVLPVDQYQPFDQVKAVTQDQYDSGALSNLIIDPATPQGPMLSVSELLANPNAIGKPSLIMGPGSAVSFADSKGFVAGVQTNEADVAITGPTLLDSGLTQITFGKGGNNEWKGDYYTGAVFDRHFTFSINKSNIQEFYIDYYEIDDYLGVMVSNNLVGEKVVGIFPYGGDRLEQICSSEEYKKNYPAQAVSLYNQNTFAGYFLSDDLLPEYGGRCLIQFADKVFRRPENYGKDGVQSVKVDLLPYLQDGINTLRTRTIVAGTGRTYLRMKIKGCN